MVEITLIRHAQTQGNRQGILLGEKEAALDERAYDEILNVRNKYMKQSYDLYYSSAQVRARATAEILFERKNIISDERLCGRRLGEWSGKSALSLRKDFPDIFKEKYIYFYCYPKGGENFISFIKRVYDLLSDFASYDNCKIAAVTHGTIINAIECLINMKSLEYIYLEPDSHLKERTFIISKDNIPSIQEFVFQEIEKSKFMIRKKGEEKYEHSI